MAYNPNAPADDQFLADFPAEQREQQRAILEDQIVDADSVRGVIPGNANGNIAINNGTRNVNLNADLLDGKEAVEFAIATHTHSVATTNDNGFMSNTDKSKLDGISSGAEVNQNAFANVKVGSTTIQADAKQDTLELTAGTNITLTPDQTNDKVTIAAPNVLPLAGGTLTGNVTMSKSAPHVELKDTVIERNTNPSANYAQVEINGKDKNSANTWGLYHRYWTTKQHEIALLCYKGTTTDNTYTSIACGYDSSGNAYTTATTPAAGDNSTKIATTAFVHNYLPLAGGTMTGTITTSAVDFIKRNVNNNHLTIMGGTEYGNSASVRLAGGDETGQTGLFQLRAQDGTSYKDLLGKPDGTLTWDSKEVLPQKLYQVSVSNTNVANNTDVALGTQVTIPKGTYVVWAYGMFNTGTTTTGIREVGWADVTSSSGTSYNLLGQNAGYSSNEFVTGFGIVCVSANTKVRFFAKQTSGATKQVSGGVVFLRLSSDDLV